MILFAVLFILGLILAVYTLNSRELPDASNLQRHASSTRTALALTSDALLGPFPTSTAPSPTWTHTRTPTRTRTPTATPDVLITFTARTLDPRATFTNTPRPPATSTPRPTRTPVPPRPTNSPVPPTVPPPTQQPTTYP